MEIVTCQMMSHPSDIILLLTNCEVHTAKYSDRSFEVWTE